MMEIIQEEILIYLEATGQFCHGFELWRRVDQGRTAYSS